MPGHFRVHNGWLLGAQFCPSPNFNRRPNHASLYLLVIHNISLPPNEFGGGHVHRFFQNNLDDCVHPYFATIRDLKVSAHLFIDRAGKVTQFVSFNDRAWHAGISYFDGVENCNDFSIGIELEGADSIAYTDMQYASLREVSRVLLLNYPTLTQDCIVGHEHIAPGRKTDPGPAFDWPRYFESLHTNNTTCANHKS